MPLITTLQKERERLEFDYYELPPGCEKVEGVFTSNDGAVMRYKAKQVDIKSFLTKSHIRLLESLKEELPKNMEILEIFKESFSADDTEEHKYKRMQMGNWHAWGFNKALSTIHQIIDNAIKSIDETKII